MATKNDVTGDQIKSKPASDLYRQNYDSIFGEKPIKQPETSDGKNDMV